MRVRKSESWRPLAGSTRWSSAARDGRRPTDGPRRRSRRRPRRTAGRRPTRRGAASSSADPRPTALALLRQTQHRKPRQPDARGDDLVGLLGPRGGPHERAAQGQQAGADAGVQPGEQRVAVVGGGRRGRRGRRTERDQGPVDVEEEERTQRALTLRGRGHGAAPYWRDGETDTGGSAARTDSGAWWWRAAWGRLRRWCGPCGQWRRTDGAPRGGGRVRRRRRCGGPRPR